MRSIAAGSPVLCRLRKTATRRSPPVFAGIVVAVSDERGQDTRIAVRLTVPRLVAAGTTAEGIAWEVYEPAQLRYVTRLSRVRSAI